MTTLSTHILALLVLLGACTVLSSCTSTDVLRTGQEHCQEGVRLKADDDLGRPLSYKEYENARCPTTTYHLPLKNSDPRDIAEYTYSFLELDEDKPAELKDRGTEQWPKLERALVGPRQKYVIVFVHGWRNDASPQSPDDRRFRTLLAYARQFLNQRCRSSERRYCNTQLVGVFMGWRGAKVKEIPNSNLALPASLWTFWGRKQKSEQHAEGIVNHLQKIESHLRLEPGDPSADKMLVIGHSFGGNMLATALHACLTGSGNHNIFCGDGARKIRKIADYKAKDLATPPLGDLTVIVNPAAELKKWSDIQRAVRMRNGYGIETPAQVDSLFRRDQRPTYISLTSTRNWSAAEVCVQGKDGKQICDTNRDWATEMLFPLGQFYKRDFEQRTALGHAFPSETYPFGASHEVSTTASDAPPTSFLKALLPENAICEIQDRWLWNARGFSEAGRGYWDTLSEVDGKPKNHLFVRRTGAGRTAITQQFRMGLAPEGRNPGVRSFEPANTPFWNVRANPNVIANHSSYINYPLWCSLNQMVLDDITRH